jgi:diguanylate cyclase (GGDEF)-like protein/PAS domain S-box-containing protein
MFSMFSKNAYTNITLTKIIVSGFAVVIVFISAIFLFGIWSVYKHNNDLKDSAFSRGFKVAIVGDMLSTTYYRSQSTMLLYGRGYKEFSLFDQDYQKSTKDFHNAINSLGEMGTTAEQKKIIEGVIKKSQEIDATQQYLYNYFSLYEDEIPNPKFSPDEVAQLYESLDQSIKYLLEYEQVGWFRDVSNNIDYSENLYKLGFTLFLIVFFICGIIGFKITRLVGSAENRLLNQKEYAQATLISISDGVITVDSDGEVRQINKTAQNLTGWTEEEAVGEKLYDVYKSYSLNNNLRIDHPFCKPEEAKDKLYNSHFLRSKAGVIYEVDSSYSVVKSNERRVGGAVLIFRDVTESKDLSRELEWQASHDALTGLMNRNTFELKINQSIINAVENDVKYALLFIDLDQFKVVNDTCGHVAGDELLSQVGVIFEKCIRKTDTLARLGGDEFGILLTDCDEELAYLISDKLLKSISEFRFVWDDKAFSVGASIGFIVIDQRATNLSELMSAADMACYAAKDSGRGRVKKYDKEISQNVNEMSMSARVTQALDEDFFELYFQEIEPLTLSNTNERVCEILIRMNFNGEVLLPHSFLPAAERYNLMCSIDRWVIDHIFSYIKESIKVGNPEHYDRYCINLSGESINDEGFIEFLEKRINEYNIPTSSLCFEITETTAITNLSNAASLIEKIKSLGCTLALDDFGTGASSFAYLKYLAVDYIKIDGTFIKDIIDDSIDLEIVSSIVKIAKVLDVKTVAEFVDNEAVLHKVKELGIDYAQGYLLSKPEPLPALGVNKNSENTVGFMS